MRLLKRILAGIVGGAIGGALVGVGESIVIALATDATEYWAFAFGAVSYALFGAAIGAGWGFVAGLFARSDDSGPTLATAAGITAALLGAVIARFRIIRDLFAESLAIASKNGIVVHVGLLVGAVVVFFLVRALLGASSRRRATAAVGVRWLGGLGVVSAAVSLVLTLVAGAGEPKEPTTPVTAKGPNVILIIADTLRADHTGPYGGHGVRPRPWTAGQGRRRIRDALFELLVDAAVGRDDPHVAVPVVA